MHRTRSFTLLTLAALSLAGWAAFRSKQHHRLAVARSKAKPEALQTWEGEGGGLPDTGRGVNAPSPGAAMSQRWSGGV